ncbi:bifunctional aspartate kinase/homoserine dehydrogenase I [Deminuibacter soli]|uniref:Bifunctional aspartate kinase/homoserine dehydrogenase I n=1 Tax=Deminuibacter soli TaxID=2291815 RepID=A0A3E1NHU8_9BACT|nr:bifunctional aspartate kinase/homoserine dehydrogenase I [Deminuibacter soli]RFM27530.1 bifunctional aspartate kinase/homoserine dehydrogenase I [Deminuibacter soli]
MRVLKFGGTSVANAANIQKVIAIAEQFKNEKIVVVISALGGVTDELIKAGSLAAEKDESYKEVLEALEKRHLDTAKTLLPVTLQSSCLSKVKQQFNELDEICEGVYRLNELSLRTRDRIISFGELMSSQILAAYYAAIQQPHEWLDTRQLITTNNHFGFAAVDFALTNRQIQERVKQSPANLFLAPGFVAATKEGHTTTLGRGGSDYTAAIFAAALQANALEIWTDVNGMMTADPRWVPNAKTIDQISYQEAMELSHFGAKVIYPPTIQPVMNKKIPVWVKNTFQPQAAGTLIENIPSSEGEIIRGISSINHIALLSLEGSGMIGIPGFSKRLFEALASEEINVILITQSSSEHSICVAINTADADKAKKVVDAAFETEISNGKVDPLKVERNLSVIALVGDQMKSHPGISGKMFASLGSNGINVRAIAQGSSERNISAVISYADVKKGVNVLHESFFEFDYKQLNLFITGLGNVGGKLISQLAQQKKYLQQHLKLNIRVAGMANSKNMLFKEEGIDLHNWKEEMQTGEPMQLDAFVDTIVSKNLHNAVFVDITANADVAGIYHKLLAKSIAVVACNKIACSSPYAYYQQLKSLSAEYNAQFLFETNVGAGLPVIGTLNDLLRSGDRVNSIQAVLSGTLNFVFNNYDGTRPFAEVVKQAQDEGYTEPDPRLDLGGTDVMRKIMILAREAGEQLEMEDITNTSFLPASCFDGSVDDFYNEMAKHEAHFKALYNEAATAGCKLKFVASYADGKAQVGLQHIPAAHDFYHLYGKDNIVLFRTQRYAEQPLVVKGAGAGADVTASGVFADIIRAAKV